MKQRMVGLLAFFLVCGLLLSLPLLTGCGYTMAQKALGTEPFSHHFGRTLHEKVAMRDQVKLNTQVHLPDGPGPWPTILVRNPYNMSDWFGMICRFFTRYGYACVHQDVRGRLGSEGTWEPLMHEREDGQDALRWLVTQQWQNGNIALFGMSYLGAVQWMVADLLPPEVKTIIPMNISTDLSRTMYERGMWRHEVFSVWADLMPGSGMNMLGGPSYQKAIRHYPPNEVDEKYFGRRLPWFREWQESPAGTAPLWNLPAFLALQEMPRKVKVPVLMTSGWHDIFTQGQLEDFRRLATVSSSKLIVGPWTHIQRGESDKPLPEGEGMGYQLRVVLDWLNHHLRGRPLALGTGTVQTYAIGEGRWHTWQSWPPPTEPVRFYLAHPAAQAGQAGCQVGTLSEASAATQASRSYRYDPRHPVPTEGGGGMLAFALPGYGGSRPGIVRQRPVCAREDVLSFLSEPLAHPLHIAGEIAVGLTVSSTAEDTAFTAKLMEVTPDGTAFNIQDSITSLAYRESLETPQVYTPGQTISLAFSMWPMEWEVQPGYRLRLDVSSSSFPAFHAHANRAGPWAQQRDPIPATQTVFAGGSAMSYVELPIWKGEGVGR